jgi:long-chain acyl-CoA synthetase
VYCVEIENRIAEHPAVDEVAVIGVPDEELGERVKAVVRLRPGASLDEGELRRYVAERLAAFKVPEQVEFRDTPLPRNPAGKVLKDQLRARGTGAFDPEFLG